MNVSILIPAAGASSRMQGTDKLMLQIDGVPLLQRTVSRAAQAASDVVVTLPRKSARKSCIADQPIKIIEIDNPARGMSASLSVGAQAISPNNAIMILPADMPDITTDDLDKIIAEFQRTPRIVRGASRTGKAGHPVVFPNEYLPRFANLNGDQGARALFEGQSVDLVRLPNDHAVTDLDTPEAWAAWRARYGEHG